MDEISKDENIIDIDDLEFLINIENKLAPYICGRSMSLKISCAVELSDARLKKDGVQDLIDLCASIKERMINDSETKLLDMLYKIEKGKIEIAMKPGQDTWMGDILYDVANGYTIAVFSDCFCWDYIAYILDENKNRIFKWNVGSPVSEYTVSDEVAESIYKIFDPSIKDG